MLKYYYKSSIQLNELIACDLSGMHMNTQSTDSQTSKEASAKTHKPHDTKPLISENVFRAESSQRSCSASPSFYRLGKRKSQITSLRHTDG